MKNEKILHAIGMIDDDMIEEAAPKTRMTSERKWIKYSAIAACLVVAVLSITFLPDFVNNSKTIKPVVDNIAYYDADTLEVLSCSFVSGGMGGGDFGHLVVKDYMETTSDNPTFNNVENITELPVFKNEEGLWSDFYRDLDNLDDLIYFDSSTVEETYDYNYEGKVSNTWNVCYKYDSKKNLVDQLLDYTFYRIFYTNYFENSSNISWARVLTPPSEAGILYPVISLSEAEEKLRNGNFFCYGNEESVAETAEILSVEIVYLTDEYQAYLQPFYMFYITDASWDMAGVMECENEDEFISVSPVYIPALPDEYIKITRPTVNYN